MDTFNVIIVDDDLVIRKNLVNYLTKFHKFDYELYVSSAGSAAEAMKEMANREYHLAIIDIKMPNESGFDLIEKLKIHHPQTKSVLITAYKVEDYLKTCAEKGVSNIIVKTAPFNFNELSQVINGFLKPEKYLFGLTNYLNQELDIRQETISNSHEITEVQTKLRDQMAKLKINNVELVSIAILEALTNALYHAPRNDEGKKKYTRDSIIESIEDTDIVKVEYGWDNEKFGISVLDNSGHLNRDDVLYWLNRNITGANVLESSGRGLYLMHSIADRLVINIKKGIKTEIIMMMYMKGVYSGHKPIYINQV